MSNKSAILVVGPTKVGKTQLITRLSKDALHHNENYEYTIRSASVSGDGVAFYEMGGQTFIDIFAGNSTLQEHIDKMYRNPLLLDRTVQQVLLVYDQDSIQSFMYMKRIHELFLQTRPRNGQFWRFIVVANCSRGRWDDNRTLYPRYPDRLQDFLGHYNICNYFSLCSRVFNSMDSFHRFIQSCCSDVTYTNGNLVPRRTVLYVGACRTGKSQAKARMLKDIVDINALTYTPDFFPMKVSDHTQLFIRNCKQALWHQEIGGSTLCNSSNEGQNEALFSMAELVVFFYDEERTETLVTIKEAYEKYKPAKFILVRNAITSPERRSKCNTKMLNQIKGAASCCVQLNTPKTDLNIRFLFQKIQELCEPKVLISRTATTTATITTTSVSFTTTTTTTSVSFTTTTTTTTSTTPLESMCGKLLNVSSVSRSQLSDEFSFEDEMKRGGFSLEDKVQRDRDVISKLKAKMEMLQNVHSNLQSQYFFQRKCLESVSTKS